MVDIEAIMIRNSTMNFRTRVRSLKEFGFLPIDAPKINMREVLTQGTHIVGIGGIGLQAAMLRMMYFHPEMASRTHIIGKPNWLLSKNAMFNNDAWGQPLAYLNDVTFNIARQVLPEQGIHDPVTMEQMRLVLEAQKRTLEQTGVEMITEPISSVSFDSASGGLNVMLPEGKSPIFIPTGGKAPVIINAAREYRVPEGLSPDVAACIRSAEDLYVNPPVNNDSIVIFGSGRNLDWAIRDILKDREKFPNLKKIIHVIPPGDRVREDLVADVHRFSLLHDVELQQVHIDPKNTQVSCAEVLNGILTLRGRDFNQEEVTIFVRADSCYSAMGTKYAAHLTESMNEKQVVQIDTSNFKLYGIEGGVQLQGNSVTRNTSRGGPMPLGNFTSTTLAVTSALGINLPTDRQAITNFNIWARDVMSIMFNKGIIKEEHLSDPEKQAVFTDFFEKLSVAIVEAYGPNTFPTVEVVQAIVDNIAEKTFHGEPCDLDKMKEELAVIRGVLGTAPRQLTP